MIYGYYCVHPELVDECYEVATKKRFIERLTALNAPEILLAREQRLYEEQKSLQSDLSAFRMRIKELYSNGTVSNILDNYHTVFQDVGFDPSIAYSGNDSDYNSEKADYLKPLKNLSDEEVLSFISYTQHKFDEYIKKHTPKLNEIRTLFISHIKSSVESGLYPKSALDNLAHLEQIAVEFDDGFKTTLEGSAGWHKPYHNKIFVSTKAFDNKGTIVLFYMFFNAIAGVSDCDYGFHRLREFFDTEKVKVLVADESFSYEQPFDLINEAFVNAQSISLLSLSNKLPKWLKDEQFRDAKLGAIIVHTGKQGIPKEIFYNAYFSGNMDDVKALADAIRSEFNHNELFTDLQSIKDICSVDEIQYKGTDRAEKRKFLYEHRLDNIDAYFRYRYFNSPRFTDKVVSQLKEKLNRSRIIDEVLYYTLFR